MYYYRYCLHGFIREDLLQRIELPDQENASLSFTDYLQRLTRPNLTMKNPPLKSTRNHRPCGFSYIVVFQVDNYSKAPVVYRGDALDKLLECLQEEQKYIQEKLDFVEPMRVEREEEQAFRGSLSYLRIRVGSGSCS